MKIIKRKPKPPAEPESNVVSQAANEKKAADSVVKKTSPVAEKNREAGRVVEHRDRLLTHWRMACASGFDVESVAALMAILNEVLSVASMASNASSVSSDRGDEFNIDYRVICEELYATLKTVSQYKKGFSEHLQAYFEQRLQVLSNAMSMTSTVVDLSWQKRSACEHHAPRLYLIADDFSKAREWAAQFKWQSFNAFPFTDLDELVRAFKRQKPDAIVCDSELSNKAKLIVQLRKQVGTSMPIIVLTRKKATSYQRVAVRAGATACFFKPFDVVDLAAYLNGVLSSTKMPRVLLLAAGAERAQRYIGALQKKKCQVHHEPDAYAALDGVYFENCDAVLVDLEQSGLVLNEWLTLARNQVLRFDVPLVMLGDERSSTMKQAIELGVDAYLVPALQVPDHVASVVSKSAQRFMRRQGMHDYRETIDLETGTLGYTGFIDFVDHHLGQSNEQRQIGVIAYVRLEGFERFIKRIGHPEWHDLRPRFVQRFHEFLGPDDRVCFLSDNELALYVQRSEAEMFKQLTQDIQELVCFFSREYGGHAGMEARIGMAQQNQGSATQILHQAMLVCFDRSPLGASDASAEFDFRLADGNQQENVSAKQRVIVQIADAVQREQLFLMYQAIVSVGGDACARYSASMRWRDGEDEVIEPVHFLREVRHYQLMSYLSRWYFSAVLQSLGEAVKRYGEVQCYAQLRGEVLKDSVFLEWLLGLVGSLSLPAKSLVLQLSYLDIKDDLRSVLVAIERLRRAGVAVAITGIEFDRHVVACVEELSPEYLMIDDVLNVDPRLQQMDAAARKTSTHLGQLIKDAQQSGVRTIACDVQSPSSMAHFFQWGVDLFQGEVVQPMTETLDFSFEIDAV